MSTPFHTSRRDSGPLRVHVVVNPAAGQDSPVLADLNAAWPRELVDWTISITHDAGDGTQLARRAVESGHQVVGVVGGDGTVSEVAAGLLGTDVPLAILPAGTGNAAAQEFGIPLQLGEAARLLTSEAARTDRFDVLRVEDRVSILRVGVGFDARTMTAATRELKDRLGWFAYPVAALRELGSATTAKVHLDLDGVEHEVDAYAVVVANVGRMGRAGARFPGDVDPGDGLADVFLLRNMDLGALVEVGARLLRLTKDDSGADSDPMWHFRARQIRIECDDRELLYHTDGDVQGVTPLSIETLPGALPVVVPAASPGEASADQRATGAARFRPDETQQPDAASDLPLQEST